MAKPSLGMRIKGLRGEARREAIGKVVADYEASGSSVAAFCRSRGIARVTLGRWRRELRRASPAQEAAGRFVEVRAPAIPSAAVDFEITLPCGTALRVPSGFEAEELQRLLSVLRATC